MYKRQDECGWIVSRYDYTYDDRGFIVAEDAVESLYAYAWDDKHDGKHENRHDEKFPHEDKHINKHAKDGIYNFQIIGTKRSLEYDDDGKLIRATEKEDRQGTDVYKRQRCDRPARVHDGPERGIKLRIRRPWAHHQGDQRLRRSDPVRL